MKCKNSCGYYRNSIPLNTCNQPYQQSAINRMYPRRTSGDIPVSQQPFVQEPSKPVYQQQQPIQQIQASQMPFVQQPSQPVYQQKPMFETNNLNAGDSYCNQGQCRGNYPVSFGPNCGIVPPAVYGSCYPYSSILQLISKILRWKYSGIEYNTLGYMFYNAFMLYYTPDQTTPYFVTDYTYAILNSILVGNFATEEYNNSYPEDYYDKVIDALKRLQYRITDYDFRFQFNGQLCCYLVQSIPDPPENLNSPYVPNQNNQLPTQPSRGGLF